MLHLNIACKDRIRWRKNGTQEDGSSQREAEQKNTGGRNHCDRQKHGAEKASLRAGLHRGSDGSSRNFKPAVNSDTTTATSVTRSSSGKPASPYAGLSQVIFAGSVPCRW